MHDLDQEERRQKIAAIAVDVIGNQGLEAATVRNIAARAGYSTTIITHYFNDKDDLLLLAFRHISRQARERLRQVVEENPGNVLGALLGMTPLEESSHLGWRVYIAFWQKAGHEPAFAREQRQGVNYALETISRALRACHGERDDIPRIARHLLALVHGIAIQLLFDPTCWTRDEVEQTLNREIQTLLNSPEN